MSHVSHVDNSQAIMCGEQVVCLENPLQSNSYRNNQQDATLYQIYYSIFK